MSKLPCNAMAHSKQVSVATQAANAIGSALGGLFPVITDDDDWEDEEEPEMEMDHVANFPNASAPSIPTPMDVDPVLNDKNNPDPFYYPPAPSQPPPTAAEVHPN
jgi:hypothetical protein